MAETPTFFVPFAQPGKEEEAYAELARWCERPVPPSGQRIYSITFIHDGEEWTATVGQCLRGVKLRRPRRKRDPVQRGVQVTDGATVLAIFAGVPYLVATNAFPGGVRSAWVNPFMAGKPEYVTYFAAPAERQ